MQVIILIPTSYFLCWWTLDLLRIHRSNKLSILFDLIYNLQCCEHFSLNRDSSYLVTDLNIFHSIILCNFKNMYLPGNSPWANGHLIQDPCLVVNWNQKNLLGKPNFPFQSVAKYSTSDDQGIPESCRKLIHSFPALWNLPTFDLN